MKKTTRTQRGIVHAAGMAAGGLGGVQTLEAAVQHQSVDVDIPTEVSDYHVDLNGDAPREFDIQVFANVVKVADFEEIGASTGAFVAVDNDGLTANLAKGTPIDLSIGFGVPTQDRLSGTTTDDFDGNFQVSDGPGYIGVSFLIEGQTHYGYMGYEGSGAERRVLILEHKLPTNASSITDPSDRSADFSCAVGQVPLVRRCGRSM